MTISAVLFLTVTLFIIPWRVSALTTVCQQLGQCPANANCEVAGQACQCNPGFHEVDDACVQDVPPGFPCTMAGQAGVCAVNAECVSVVPEAGANATLQCACLPGYLQSANVGGVANCLKGPDTPCSAGAGECHPDTTCTSPPMTETVNVSAQCTCKSGLHPLETSGILLCASDVRPGGPCSTAGDASQCVGNATCAGPAPGDSAVTPLQCQCDTGFHPMADSDDAAASPTSCQPDVALDSTCSVVNSSECVVNAVCLNVAGSGQPADLKCRCGPGFHVGAAEGSDDSSCRSDVPPGGACVTLNDVIECVEGATCASVSGALQCTCSSGFHLVSPGDAGTKYCAADVAVGGTCASSGSDVECVEGATCAQGPQDGGASVSTCQCKSEYHEAGGDSPRCDKDKTPNSPCLLKLSQECVENAVCINVAAPGVAEVLQCTCQPGSHADRAVSPPSSCAEDLVPGARCLEAGGDECVENAQCLNVSSSSPEAMAAGGSPVCVCPLQAFHVETLTGKPHRCQPDTCQHTKDKCVAAPQTTCSEVDAFLGCVLAGACLSEDPEQVEVFSQTLTHTERQLLDTCDYTASSTCTEKVTGCLRAFYKTGSTCQSLETLSECMTGLQTDCSMDNGFQLTEKFITSTHLTLSCECWEAATGCEKTYAVGSTETTASEKCRAAQDLLTCGLGLPCCSWGGSGSIRGKKIGPHAAQDLLTCSLDLPQCNSSRPADMILMAALWNTASQAAGDNDCKNSITEADATSCHLKLARCALNYGDEKSDAGEDRTQMCRSTEEFGGCVNATTSTCTGEDAAATDLFQHQYAMDSAACLCVNKLTECREEAGQLTNDSVQACPKVAKYGRCILGARCQLVNDDLIDLNAAHLWYNQHLESANCVVTSDDSCSTDVDVCSDTLIRSALKADSPASEKCSAVEDSVLCVRAANCSSDVPADVELLTSSNMAGGYRLQSLACKEPTTCSGTNDDLMWCKRVYETDFLSADTDNALKCTAKNSLVRCMRPFLCNRHMTDVIQLKYGALQNVLVPGCELLSLQPPSDSAAAHCPHCGLLALLVCLAVTLAAAAVGTP